MKFKNKLNTLKTNRKHDFKINFKNKFKNNFKNNLKLLKTTLGFPITPKLHMM